MIVKLEYRLYEITPLKIISSNCVKVYTHTVEEGFTIDSKEVSTLFCPYADVQKMTPEGGADIRSKLLFVLCPIVTAKLPVRSLNLLVDEEAMRNEK